MIFHTHLSLSPNQEESRESYRRKAESVEVGNPEERNRESHGAILGSTSLAARERGEDLRHEQYGEREIHE
jgi:hypothetical protein